MTHKSELIEQHILAHESHLKHIDELLRRAQAHLESRPAAPDAASELTELRGERAKLEAHLQEMKQKSPEEWASESLSRVGPLGIWDSVARRIEKFVERLD